MAKKKNKFILWGSLGAITIVIVGSLFIFGEKPPTFMSGEILIDPTLVPNAKDAKTIFIIVYDADSPMPMPYGAIRYPVYSTPEEKVMDFYMTHDNLQIMNQDRPIPRNFRVKVRLDRDGQGGQDQPGDLVGQLARVPYGAENVKLNVTQLIRQ